MALQLKLHKKIVCDPEYEKHFSTEINRLFRNPFFFCTFNLMHDLMRMGDTVLGINDPIDFIFDEQSRGKKQIFMAWDNFKANAQISKKLIGGSPIFRDDKQVLPLQAADFLAWTARRKVVSQLRFEAPKHFSWMATTKQYKAIYRIWNESTLTTYVQANIRQKQLKIKTQPY